MADEKGVTPETGTVTVQESTKPEEVKTLTVAELQAKLDEVTRHAANKEEEATRVHEKLKKFEEAEQKRADAEKSELQKAQERADKAEAEAKGIKLSLLRRDIVAEFKLPPELADFLKGETPEELKASAAILLKTIPAKVAPAGTVTNPGANALHGAETDDERRRRLGLSRG